MAGVPDRVAAEDGQPTEVFSKWSGGFSFDERKNLRNSDLGFGSDQATWTDFYTSDGAVVAIIGDVRNQISILESFPFMSLSDVLFKRDRKFNKVNDFLSGIDQDDVRTEFRDDYIYRKGPSSGGKTWNIGKDLDIAWSGINGHLKVFQDMIQNWIVTPGKTTLVKRYGAVIENMNKCFFVTTEFTFGLGSFAPSLEIGKGWQEVNGSTDREA